MKNKILKMFCCLFILVTAGCYSDPDPGTVRLAEPSNIYTIDQIDPLLKKDTDSVDITKERISQRNQFLSIAANIAAVTAKAKAGTAGASDSKGAVDSDSQYKVLKEIADTSKTGMDYDPLKADISMPYRHSMDDLSSNYEYRSISLLKYRYESLIKRGYKIFFIPLQVSVAPGKTTTEGHYLEISYSIYCKNKMEIRLVDLFPTKILDNRMNLYSSIMQNALILYLSGEFSVPKGGGAAKFEDAQMEKMQKMINCIQRVPVVTSFIDSTKKEGDEKIIHFGWNIYPELSLVNDNGCYELKYILYPNNYDFMVIAAIRGENNLSASAINTPPRITGSYSWKIAAEKRKGKIKDRELEEKNINIYSNLYEFEPYNPLTHLAPTITFCQKINDTMIKLKGTDLDCIKDKKLIVAKIVDNCRAVEVDTNREVRDLRVNKTSDAAIGILQKPLSADEIIYGIEYTYNRNASMDSGIFIINNDTQRESDSDFSLISDNPKKSKSSKPTKIVK